MIKCIFPAMAVVVFSTISASSQNFEKGITAYQAMDYASALEEFFLLAEQGNAEAQYRVGMMYYNGEGVPKKQPSLGITFEKAENGDVSEQFMAGFLIEGKGLARHDIREAIHWYSKAAKHGDARAQFALANMYYNGVGVAQNYEEAMKWYAKAAEGGNTKATESLQYSQKYWDRIPHEVKEQYKWNINEIRLGKEQEHFTADRMTNYGFGVPKDDINVAYKWFAKAAEQGHVQAQYNIGISFITGRGISSDFDKYIEWMTKAAKQGHAEAQISLGNYYFTISFSDKNAGEKSVNWYIKAAEQGHTGAQYILGKRYKDGDAQSYRDAQKWLLKAAIQGYAPAQSALGHFYQNGLAGSQDTVLASMWYDLAARNSDFIFPRYIITEKMTDSEIIKAHKMAYECFMSNYENCGY